MKISQLIAQQRRRHQLSQNDLAQIAGTSQGQISRIERGDISPTFDMAERILEALGEELVVSVKKQEVTIQKEKEINLLYNPPLLRKS